jgi:hypothetical protein
LAHLVAPHLHVLPQEVEKGLQRGSYDIPDFLTPVKRIAASMETMAGQEDAIDPSTDHSEPILPVAAIADGSVSSLVPLS